MLYKILGIFVVAGCGISAASIVRTRGKARLEGLEGLIELLRFIRSQIECFAKPLPRILSEAPRELYVQCGYTGEGAPRDLKEILENSDICDTEAREIFESASLELGRGYLREQLRCCDYYLDLLEQRRAALSEGLPAKAKAQGAVCIATALGAIIILL